MMPYWTRILIGASLGAVAAAALWLIVGIPWLTAAVAALLAAVGFLGSYFVWSADRLPEYEQVLFDRPNTIVTGLLVLAFAAAGLGTGLLASEPAPLAPGERTQVLYADYQRTADAFASKEIDAAALDEAMADLRVESDRLAVDLEALPEGEERTDLVAANDALALAMDSMRACAGGDKAQCLDARLLAADAKLALNKVVPPAAEEEPPA